MKILIAYNIPKLTNGTENIFVGRFVKKILILPNLSKRIPAMILKDEYPPTFEPLTGFVPLDIQDQSFGFYFAILFPFRFFVGYRFKDRSFLKISF